MRWQIVYAGTYVFCSQRIENPVPALAEVVNIYHRCIKMKSMSGIGLRFCRSCTREFLGSFIIFFP
jgi:hypothetical protein